MKPSEVAFLTSKVLAVAEALPEYASLSLDDKMLVVVTAGTTVTNAVTVAAQVEAMRRVFSGTPSR